MLDDGRAAIDPVAAIDVGEAVSLRGSRRCGCGPQMIPSSPRWLRRRSARSSKSKMNCNALFTGAWRSRRATSNSSHAETATDRTTFDVQGAPARRTSRRRDGDPAVMAGDLVELVAVQEQEAAPVGQRMRARRRRDVTKGDAEVVAQASS